MFSSLPALTSRIFFNKTKHAQVNLVLDDAVEYTPDPQDKTKYIQTILNTEILLNGNQIAALVPGGTGPASDLVQPSVQ